MPAVLEVAYNIISPIFIIIGIAALVGRRFNPDPRTLSRLIIYLFSPALVLDGIARSDLQADEIGQIAAMVVIFSLIMALIGWGLSRLSGFNRQLEAAFIISVMLMNAGNYGIPLNELAFGEPGLQRATVYFTCSALLSNTLGVFLVSRGTASAQRSLLNVLTVPLPYAAVLGLLLNFADLTLPSPLAWAITLLGRAAVPGMLVLLGLQLARASIRGQIKPILMATGARLVIAPLVAVPLALLLGFSGLTRQVVIIESSMSTAVMTGVLATEFNGDAEFAAATILTSTLASVVTLSVLLSLLM